MNFSFDPGSHEYKLDGIRIPSVSEILDSGNLTPPYRDGDYRARGSAVHRACFLRDSDKKFRADPRIDGYLASYEFFRKDFPVAWDLMEVSAFHPTLVYAGTLDRGKKPLVDREGLFVDIKTGEPPKKRLGLQTAAYVLLHSGYSMVIAKSVKRFGVQLDKDGGRYRLHECSDPADFDVWTGLVHRWHWERKK